MADTSNKSFGEDTSTQQGEKGGKTTGQGNFGNHEQHVNAGQQSSGHMGDSEEHADAGKIGENK